MMERRVVSWEEAFAAGPELVGGKGWNLGRLHRYGFRIPKGFVVTAMVYEELLQHEPLAALIKQAETLSVDLLTHDSGQELLSQVRQAFTEAPLPATLESELRDALLQHSLTNLPVAVRSSATAEDGDTTSFAGIHDSFLNITGWDDLLHAIKGCYASLWTPRALAYRRRMGIADRDVQMAVVVCAMVTGSTEPDTAPTTAPIAAGVTFTCDPTTGRTDLICTSAVAGLGEALVSGKVNPEEIKVSASRVPMHIVERQPAPAPAQPVLTDEQVLQLSRLAHRIFWALGDGQTAQDIEWAFDGTDFWIVQARPVTHLPRLTPEAIKHEPAIWSNANLKDALPGVLTPMAWSLTQPVVSNIIFAPFESIGHQVPAGLETVRRYKGRAYFDITIMQWVFFDALGVTSDQFNSSMGGHHPSIATDSDPYRGPDGRRRRRNTLKMLRKVWGLQRRLPHELNAVYAEVNEFKRRNLASLSNGELLNELLTLTRRTVHFGPLSQLANTASGIWPTILEQTLAPAAKADASRVAAQLVAGFGGNVSAEQGYRLFDLAAAAAEDTEAQAFLTRYETDPMGWKSLPHGSAFRREMERFLADFGHRAVYEVEIANPRWNEDPSYILEQVNALSSGSRLSLRERAEQTRHAAETQLKGLSVMLRPLILFLAKKASTAAAQREAAKSAMVAFLEPMRGIIKEVGRRLTQRQFLDEPDDLFYLTWADVLSYLLEEWDGKGARSLAADKRAQREAWLRDDVADVFVFDKDGNPVDWESGLSTGVPAQSVGPTPSANMDKKGALQGIAAASGRATGIARILHHPDQAARLNTGDILVAPSTDPGWTPLFTRAAAIVMEVGGYQSHGAIVAREFGIPAVVNVKSVLSIVEDGETITVDGDHGLVLRERES